LDGCSSGRPGTLLLIERGSTHQIRNTGRTPLKALSLYVPPAPQAASTSGVPLNRTPLKRSSILTPWTTSSASRTDVVNVD
jgi:hypothetical protein